MDEFRDAANNSNLTTIDFQDMLEFLDFSMPLSMPSISSNFPIVQSDARLDPTGSNDFLTPPVESLLESRSYYNLQDSNEFENIRNELNKMLQANQLEIGNNGTPEDVRNGLSKIAPSQASQSKLDIPVNELIIPNSDEFLSTLVMISSFPSDRDHKDASDEQLLKCDLQERSFVQSYQNQNDSVPVTRSNSSKSIDFIGIMENMKLAKVVIPRIDISHILSKRPKKASSRKRNRRPSLKKANSMKTLALKSMEAYTNHTPELRSEIRGITPEVLAQLISEAVIQFGRNRELPLLPNQNSCESTRLINKIDVWSSSNDEKSRFLKWDPIMLSKSINEVNAIREYKHHLETSINRSFYSKIVTVHQNTDHAQFELIIKSAVISAELWKIHAIRQLPENEAKRMICKKGDLILVTNLNLFGYIAEDSKEVNEAGIDLELVTLEIAKNDNANVKRDTVIKIRCFGVHFDEYLRRIEILSLLKENNFFIKSICCPWLNFGSENEVITNKGRYFIDACLRSIHSNKPSVQFLSGPAGSGKTQILVDFLLQFLQESNCNILVITKTEYSADNLCKRFADVDSKKHYPIIRYCESDRIDPVLVSYARNVNQTSRLSLLDYKIIIISVDACYTVEFQRDFIFTHTNETYLGPIFEATIIDDANYMNEEALLLAFVTAQKLVVVSGDTFDKNWFSEMTRKHDQIAAKNVVHLTTQYRCHSKIMSCLNHLCGHLRMVFPDHIMTLPKHKVKPLTIVNFATEDGEDMLEKSVVFGKLIAEYIVNSSQNVEVGIVVATQKQANAIEGCFDSRSGDRILAGLMEKFYGLEKEVVIVCPAIDDDVERFLYVAMTRAKHSVIICGDFSKIRAKLLTQWADHRKSIILWQKEPEKFPFSTLVYQN